MRAGIVGLFLLANPLVGRAAGLDEGLRAGAVEIGVSAGYGRQHETPPGARSDLRQVTTLIRAGWVLLGPVGPPGLRGSLEVAGEVMVADFSNADHGTVFGVSPFLRYHFLTGSPWVPYVAFGAGLVYLGLNVEEQSTKWNFTLQPAIGLQYGLSDHWSVTAEYRFQHISNAHAGGRNLGLNSSVGLVGISYLFQ